MQEVVVICRFCDFRVKADVMVMFFCFYYKCLFVPYMPFIGCRAEEIANFIELQDKEMEDFVGEREKLIKEHEDKMAAMKRRHWDEEVKLEKEFDAQLASLMKKYSPHQSEGTANL